MGTVTVRVVCVGGGGVYHHFIFFALYIYGFFVTIISAGHGVVRVAKKDDFFLAKERGRELTRLLEKNRSTSNLVGV